MIHDIWFVCSFIFKCWYLFACVLSWKVKAKVKVVKPKAGPKVKVVKPKAGPKVKVVKPKGPPKGAVKVGGSGGEPLKRKTKHDKDKKDDAFFVHAANQPEWARELLDMSLIGNS